MHKLDALVRVELVIDLILFLAKGSRVFKFKDRGWCVFDVADEGSWWMSVTVDPEDYAFLGQDGVSVPQLQSRQMYSSSLVAEPTTT